MPEISPNPRSKRNFSPLITVILIAGWLALADGTGAPASEPSNSSKLELTAGEIVRRVVRQARAQSQKETLPPYNYSRRVLTEEMDREGTVTKRTQRRYAVAPEEGGWKSVLLEKNGVAVGLDRKEAADAEDVRVRLEKAHREGGGEREEVDLEEGLVNRYHFVLAGEENVRGRPVYVLEFQPKEGLPMKKLQDRVMHRMAGKVWIDQEEFEVAKLNAWLLERVTLGLGLLGALHEFEIFVERVRLEPGVWLTGQSRGWVGYRELFNSKLLRWREQMEEFQKIEP